MKLIGYENKVTFAIKGVHVVATRTNGVWRLPVEHAVTAKNEFRNLRDLRSAVRAANKGTDHDDKNAKS